MIINVRGGCGAGKSTLVKQIINQLGVKNSLDPLPGRIKNSGYMLNGGVFVIGHYDIQNGGLDTIGNLREAYELIENCARFGDRPGRVLYEGMNQKQDVPRVCELSQRYEMRVIVLNTPYDECLASFLAKGQHRSEDYVGQTHRKANRDAIRLENFGVNVKMLNRADALAETRRLLGC